MQKSKLEECLAKGFTLDVHHVSPEHKDPNFASSRGWSKAKLIEEMKHCVLLCKCCHAAVHHGDLVLRFCEDCECLLSQFGDNRWHCDNEECDTGWIVEYPAGHFV
jgi:hypothetical protein